MKNTAIHIKKYRHFFLQIPNTVIGLLLFCSVGFVQTSRAQIYTIEGYVKDTVLNTPLEGATVVFDKNKSQKSTKTDKNGYFSIYMVGGDHIIDVRYVGYVPYSKFIKGQKQNLSLQISMETLESQLEQVVVTSKGYDPNVRRPLLGVSQVNIKTFQKLPAAFGEVDILRGIQMLPGVTSVGEASNGVNIRGGTTDQNLILMDDTPIFNPTHMFGLFSVFPPDAVSNLDLYKGNVPSRYGGRAASVMDITLKNPSLEAFKIKGGVSLVSNRLMAEVPVLKNKLGFYVAGRGAFNDFLLPVISDELKNIRTKFGEGVFKAFWRINERNTLTGMAYKSTDYFKTDLLTNLPNVVGTSSYFNHQTTNAMLRWAAILSSRADIQTSFVVANYTPSISTIEKDTENAIDLVSDLLQKQLKSSFNYQLEKHKIETGVSVIQYTIKPGTLFPNQSVSVQYITTPTEFANELAVYADDEWNISKQLAISSGIRYSYFMAMGPSNYRIYDPTQPRDDFSVIDTVAIPKGKVMKSYGGFEPRIGLRYAPKSNVSLKFGYNLMRQYLQIVSNTTTPIPTSRWKTSDQYTKPQVSNLLSAGYYRTLSSNIYEYSVEGYYRFAKNIVDYKPGADFLLQMYPETQIVQGISKAYGIELMFSKKKGKLTGWANYTYSRTLNQTNNDLLPFEQVNGGEWYAANYDRPHGFNTAVDIKVDEHNSFGFVFVYSQGRPYTEPVGYVNYLENFYPFYEKRNNQRIPDYHRLDFSWNIYNPRMKNTRYKTHWAFSVYNLYGHKNVYSIFFKTEDNLNKAYKLQIFAAPIITLAYNFEF